MPRSAAAVKEIRDQWGRITYELNLDDGSIIEARFSSRIPLGGGLLYFGSSTNPRPVDPLLLALEDLGPVP